MKMYNQQGDAEINKKMQDLFSSPTGKEVLEFIERTYVDPSCIASSPEHTYFNLGQQELAKTLIQLSRGDENGEPEIHPKGA